MMESSSQGIDAPTTSGGASCSTPDITSPDAKRRRTTASASSEDDDDDDNDRLVICGDEREILQLSKQIDENLEKKANAHNLTALNVKSILHHLIKYPKVISLVMGLTPDDEKLDYQPKLTRLKAKQLVEQAGMSWYASPLKDPIVKARTFLDVDYDNEDEDDDYDPSTEVTVESDWDEDADTSLDGLGPSSRESTPRQTAKDAFMGPPRTPIVLKSHVRRKMSQIDQIAREQEQTDQSSASADDLPAYHTRSKQSITDFAIDEFDRALMQFDPDVSFSTPMPDIPLDLEYLEFITSVAVNSDANRTAFDEDDANDPEYNFLADPETSTCDRDNDETRMDRATEIPRKEVQGLLEDLFVLFRNDDSVDDVSSPAGSSQGEDNEQQSTTDQQLDVDAPLNKHMLLLANTIPYSRRHCQRFTQEVLFEYPDSAHSSSASLLGDPKQPTVPMFTDCELAQLECQMQKHVQLLLQNALLTKFEDGFSYQANGNIKMLYEIKTQADAKLPGSYFNACNLASAIELIEQPSFDTSNMPTRVQKCASGVAKFNRKLKAVQPPVMVALAQSTAILYPELLPLVRPSVFGNTKPLFMSSEDNLLALGIGQFHHVPFATASNLVGRWDYIQSNLLPVKTKRAILDRVKHLRRTRAQLSHVVVFTEKNKIAPGMPLHTHANARFGLRPVDWNTDEQTPWLQTYCNWKRGELYQRVNAGSSKPARPKPSAILKEDAEEGSRRIDDIIISVAASARQSSTQIDTFDLSMPDNFPSRPADDKEDKDIANLLAHMSEIGVINESVVPVSDIRPVENTDQTTPPSSPAQADCVPTPVPYSSDANLTVVYIDQKTPPLSPRSMPLAVADQKWKQISPPKFRPILPKKLQSPLRLSTIHKMNSGSRKSVVLKIAPRRAPFAPVLVMGHGGGSSQVLKAQMQQQQPGGAAKAAVAAEGDAHSSVVADVSGADEPARAAAPDRKSRKRSRKERERDGLEAMLLNGDCEKTTLALGEAFVDDIFRRFFMHQDKLRDFCQAVASASDASPEQAFPKIAETLGDSSLLGRLLSAFLSPENALKLGVYDVRQQYFEVLERVVMIERYFSRARSKGGAKALFRSLKELGPLCTREELYFKLKSLLSGDEPLWRILKPMFPSEPFDEKVRDEDFETIEDLPDNDDLFETIDSLPTTFRSSAPCSIAAAGSSKAICQCLCHTSATDSSPHCTHCRIKVTNGRLYLHNGTKYCPAIAEHGPIANSSVGRVHWKSLNEDGHCVPYEDDTLDLQKVQEPREDATANDGQDESDSDAIVVENLVTAGDLCENSQLRGFLSLVDQLEPGAAVTEEHREQPDQLRSAMIDAFGSSRLSFTSNNSPARSEPPDDDAVIEEVEDDDAWTADEDRLLLSAYNLLESDFALTLEHVGGQMPNRTAAKVESRLRFLLSLFEGNADNPT